MEKQTAGSKISFQHGPSKTDSRHQKNYHRTMIADSEKLTTVKNSEEQSSTNLHAFNAAAWCRCLLQLQRASVGNRLKFFSNIDARISHIYIPINYT
jgi:hypothetical protein